MEQADNNLPTHVGLIPDELRREAQRLLKMQGYPAVGFGNDLAIYDLP